MDNNSISQLIQTVDIFKGIPAELIDTLSENLSINSFNKDSPIINKGEKGESMFIIAEGRVKVHDGEHTIATLEKGNFFGEFSLLDAAPRSMSVTALQEVKAISIGRELFYDLLQSRPEVTKKMISTLTGRLRKQNDSIISELKTREAELKRLVDERTAELKKSNEEISNKNREITDNVNYAKRIQAAILPDIGLVKKSLPESFILYMPKDIVSGDFFSFFSVNNKEIIVAADCTGHGVTGAFLSVIGSSLLNQLIVGKNITTPGKILDLLHDEMIQTLNQQSNDSTDGMDISICSIDKKNNRLQYAGANRPLWLIRNNEIIVHVPDKIPVGGTQQKHESPFRTVTITPEKNDSVYIFTDGFADQFGGENNKKIMTKKFKEVLLAIQNLNMNEQKHFLKNFFEEWKGSNEQIDDVLVIGFKIS